MTPISKRFIFLTCCQSIIANKCSGQTKSMIRKYDNHTLQNDPWYNEEEPHINHKPPRRPSKATSSLFPIKMVVKLERTQSNVQQNIEQHWHPQWEQQSTTNRQQQNRRLKTDSSINHWGGGLKCILLVPNLRPRFCCC